METIEIAPHYYVDWRPDRGLDKSIESIGSDCLIMSNDPRNAADSDAECLTEADAVPDFLDGQRRLYFVGTQLKRGHAVKVGVSVNVPVRFARLQSASPVALTIFATFPGSFALEKRVHRNWQRQRLHGEWFRLTDAMCRTIARMKTQ